MRGRKPTKSNKLKALLGEKRRVNNSPDPGPGDATPPDWLQGHALEEWTRLAADLVALGVLTALDRALFTAYCVSYGEWRLAQETIQKDGATFTTPSGQVKRHPCVSIADSAAKRMRLLGAEFGLTPFDRQRLDVDPVRPPSAKGRFFVDPLEAHLQEGERQDKGRFFGSQP